MSYFYWCILYEDFSLDTEGAFLFACPYDALIYAYKTLCRAYNPEVSIYKIPRTLNMANANFQFEHFDVDFEDYRFRIYINNHVDKERYGAKRIIMRHYRKYHKRKLDAVIFLQYHLRKAIANPYTELCRRRLLREFNDIMKCIILQKQ